MICKDILDKGKCLASIPRYYYNSATKTCEEFIYTGCGGSNNNFISKQSCMNVCGKNGMFDHLGFVINMRLYQVVIKTIEQLYFECYYLDLFSMSDRVFCCSQEANIGALLKSL